MKTQFGQMAGKIIQVGFIALLALASGCKKEQRNNIIFQKTDIFRPKLDNLNLLEPKTDTTPSISSTFNMDEKLLSYSITFPKGLVPTKIYFSKGTPVDPKDSIVGPYTSPVTGTTTALKAVEQDSLLADNWVIYINAKKYPMGSIKAKLIKN